MRQTNPLFGLAIITFIVLLTHCKTPDRQSDASEPWFRIQNEQEEYGYVDKAGTVKIPFGKYTLCFTDTFRTLAIVSQRNKGFFGIDKSEKFLFQVFTYDNGPDDVNDGLFRIVQNDSIGFADTAGHVVITPKFKAVSVFTGGFAPVCPDCIKTQDGEHWMWTGGKWGFIDKTGAIVIDPVYEAVIVPFNQGKAQVKLNGEEFWIDEKGGPRN